MIQPYEVKIWVGFQEQYTDVIHIIEEAEAICQEYCDEVSLCVTVTPTRFIYKKGNEPGCIVGLINYPRFPSTPEEIFDKAVNLANLLMIELGQFRVTIQAPDKVKMLENPDL